MSLVEAPGLKNPTRVTVDDTVFSPRKRTCNKTCLDGVPVLRLRKMGATSSLTARPLKKEPILNPLSLLTHWKKVEFFVLDSSVTYFVVRDADGTAFLLFLSKLNPLTSPHHPFFPHVLRTGVGKVDKDLVYYVFAKGLDIDLELPGTNSFVCSLKTGLTSHLFNRGDQLEILVQALFAIHYGRVKYNFWNTAFVQRLENPGPMSLLAKYQGLVAGVAGVSIKNKFVALTVECVGSGERVVAGTQRDALLFLGQWYEEKGCVITAELEKLVGGVHKMRAILQYMKIGKFARKDHELSSAQDFERIFPNLFTLFSDATLLLDRCATVTTTKGSRLVVDAEAFF